MATSKHTHKLKRITYKSGNSTFFCVLDCSFKISTPLALGKTVICWRCGNEFQMNEYSLRLAKPHCEACHKSKGVSLDTETKPTEILTTTISELGHEPLSGMTLAERLQQTLKKAQTEEEEL